MNSGEARKRADNPQARLAKRMDELRRERRISALPPVVLGGLLVVPAGLLAAMTDEDERLIVQNLVGPDPFLSAYCRPAGHL